MVAIKPRDVEAFLAEPAPTIDAILIYGPDQGLVAERLDGLLNNLVTDPNDPFSVSKLEDAELLRAPARLSEELGALSFGINRRTVVVRGATGAAADLIAAVLGQERASNLLVCAGDLKPRSALRKAFESDAHAAAVPCYRDDEQSLSSLIDQVLSELGQTIDSDARSNLCARLGADRLTSRNEVEKLALYAGPGARITSADVDAICSDASRETVDQLIDAMCEGNPATLERSLDKAREAGSAPGQLMRAALTHLQTLHRITNDVAHGEPSSSAIGRLRPPVHFTRRNSLNKQLRLWRARTLRRALDLASEGERASRGDQALAQSTVSRILLQISMLVAARS